VKEYGFGNAAILIRID